MALACGHVPHFTTIAAFMSGHPEKVSEVFGDLIPDKYYDVTP